VFLPLPWILSLSSLDPGPLFPCRPQGGENLGGLKIGGGIKYLKLRGKIEIGGSGKIFGTVRRNLSGS
jgi:hypothetical protein